MDLLENARRIAEGETKIIARECLIPLCAVFGVRDVIGQFDFPASDPLGAHERVVALCLADEILLGDIRRENPKCSSVELVIRGNRETRSAAVRLTGQSAP